jgi:hypothetical protein
MTEVTARKIHVGQNACWGIWRQGKGWPCSGAQSGWNGMSVVMSTCNWDISNSPYMSRYEIAALPQRKGLVHKSSASEQNVGPLLWTSLFSNI